MLVELVGPAGAGKSLLADRLRARGDVVRASVWNLPRPLIFESAFRSLPVLLRMCVETRAFPRAELEQIVRLNALRLFVARRVAGARVIVLDEGPVFALSWLRVFGHPRIQNGRLESWWRRTLQDWAGILDRVGMRLELLRPGAGFEELHDTMLAITPVGEELELHLNLLRHGRRTCHARKPECRDCALRRMCPSADTFG